MTKRMTKDFYNFAGGLNYEDSKLAIGASLDKVYWEKSSNIRIFKNSGLIRINGNKSLITSSLLSDKIDGIHGFKINNTWHCIFASGGNLYLFDVGAGTYSLINIGLTSGEKCTFTNYGDGVIIADGTTEQFIYFPIRDTNTSGTVSGTISTNAITGTLTKFTSELAVGDKIILSGVSYIVDTITDDTHLTVRGLLSASYASISLTLDRISYLCTNSINIGSSDIDIRSKIIAVFFDRIFIGQERGLHWSALGKYNDWETANDAGFTYDIGKILKAIVSYKGSLVIHHGTNSGTTLMTGSTDPNAFAFQFDFSDKATDSPYGIATIENNQYFVDRGVFAMSQVGELNQIRLTGEYSAKLRNQFGFLQGLYDTGRDSEVIAIPYLKRREIWFYFPMLNCSDFCEVHIYDYVNKCWYKIVQPQNITSACIFDNFILTGTSDGNILIEDYGNDFDGEFIPFEWESQFFNFAQINKDIEVDEFFIILESEITNSFNFSTRFNYDDSQTFDEYLIENDEDNSGIWDDDNSLWDGDKVWAIAVNNDIKEQLYGHNKSFKLLFTGTVPRNNICIMGFQFRDIFVD